MYIQHDVTVLINKYANLSCWSIFRLYLTRQELDNPHKKKVAHVFREHFTVEVKFQKVEPPAMWCVLHYAIFTVFFISN